MHGDMVLDVSEPTFARQLQKAGYSTAIAGKWQLSFLAHQDWVHDFGFDTYMLWQIVGEEGQRTTRYYEPYYRKDGKVIADEIADRYGPDVLVEYLIEFMDHSRQDGPFMAYYAALLPHFPFIPTPDSEDQTMPEHVGEGHFRGDPRFFPDMVHRLDKNVQRLGLRLGTLLQSLDDMGIADNTIVVFIADNGTDQHVSAYWNGLRIDGGKATLTDRGTLVPLLIRWPEKITPGTVDNELVELADFFPTLVELAGADLPEEEIHGKSFAHRLFKADESIKPWVHVQMGNNRYLRSLEWIVTNRDLYQKVQPYPIDPKNVELEQLNEQEARFVQQLKVDLYRLVEPSEDTGASSSNQGYLLPIHEADLMGNWDETVIFDPLFGINPYTERTGLGYASAHFSQTVEKTGTYDLQIAYTSHKNRSDDISVLISHNNEVVELKINQQRHPDIDNLFKSVGAFTFHENEQVDIEIKNPDNGKVMMIDAIRFSPLDTSSSD